MAGLIVLYGFGLGRGRGVCHRCGPRSWTGPGPVRDRSGRFLGSARLRGSSDQLVLANRLVLAYRIG